MMKMTVLATIVTLLVAIVAINTNAESIRKHKKVPCSKHVDGQAVYQCTFVKEANDNSMYVYVSEGRGGMTPLEKRGPLGYKFKKPIFKKICKKEEERQTYYYSCTGGCGTCCLEGQPLDQDRPIWAEYGHWANGKAKCMGKKRPQSPWKPPSETLKDIGKFYSPYNLHSKGGYKCHPTNVGSNKKNKYEAKDEIMHIKTKMGEIFMRAHECYEKCIARAAKLEKEEDPQGDDLCCQFQQYKEEKMNERKEVVDAYQTCKLFRYDSFATSVSSYLHIEKGKNGDYVRKTDFYKARSVPKGNPRESLKYLLNKPTRWSYLPKYRTKDRFYD